MGQVPNSNSISYAILGRGRTSFFFQTLFEHHRIPFKVFNSRSNPDTNFSDKAGRFTHCILAVPDQSILSTYESWKTFFGPQVFWIHLSGALSFCSVGIYGAHPLMTFNKNPLRIEEALQVAFGLENDTLNGEPWKDLENTLPGLKNPKFQIPLHLKEKYHALCVLSGNFVSGLWLSVGKEFQQELGISPQVLVSFLQRSVKNTLQCFDPEFDLKNSENWKSILSGPLIRGDQATLLAHQKAFGDSEWLPLYKQMLLFLSQQLERTSI